MFTVIDRLQNLVDSENVNQDLITTAEGVCKVSALIYFSGDIVYTDKWN